MGRAVGLGEVLQVLGEGKTKGKSPGEGERWIQEREDVKEQNLEMVGWG